MSQIISPWIFYLINVMQNLSTALEYLLLILIVWFAFKIIAILWEHSFEEFILYAKNVWQTLILICVVSVMMIIIPSEETMYTMLVANYVTYDNVEKATDAIKDSVDYIFDKIDGEKSND